MNDPNTRTVETNSAGKTAEVTVYEDGYPLATGRVTLENGTLAEAHIAASEKAEDETHKARKERARRRA